MSNLARHFEEETQIRAMFQASESRSLAEVLSGGDASALRELTPDETGAFLGALEHLAYVDAIERGDAEAERIANYREAKIERERVDLRRQRAEWRAIRESLRAEWRAIRESLVARTRQQATPKPRARGAPRAPRRASAAQSAGPGGADGPPPAPEPPKPRHVRVGQSVDAPILVNQRTALALFGWTARRYIAFLHRKGVQHVVDGRLFVARVADVVAALGLPLEPAPQAVAAPSLDWRQRAELRLVSGGKRGVR